MNCWQILYLFLFQQKCPKLYFPANFLVKISQPVDTSPRFKNANKRMDVVPGPYLFLPWGGKGVCGGHIPVIKQKTFIDSGLGEWAGWSNWQNSNMSVAQTRSVRHSTHLITKPDILVIKQNLTSQQGQSTGNTQIPAYGYLNEGEWPWVSQPAARNRLRNRLSSYRSVVCITTKNEWSTIIYEANKWS